MLRPVAVALFCLFAAAASAQTPTTLRGVIAAAAGDALTFTTRGGETVQARLAPKPRILAVVAAKAEDIKPGAFVGVAAEPDGDGLKALEIHVFDESLRGTGEGNRAFDLSPNSTMTNGALSTRVGGVNGDQLTVTYNGGQQTIRLPKEAPIVAIVPGAREDIKAGAAAILRGGKTADGGFDAAVVIVGRDGVTPPM